MSNILSRGMLVALGAFVLANTADAVITWFGLHHGHTEGNGFLRFQMQFMSSEVVLGLKIVIAILVGILLTLLRRSKVLWVVTGAFVLIVLYNIVVVVKGG